MVGIDLIGVGIPLLVSVAFLLVLLRRKAGGFAPRRLFSYAAFVVVVGALAAAEFGVWDYLFGGISVQTQFFLFTLIYPAGIVQFLLFDRSSKQLVSALKSYPIGTFSVTLSDLFRTFSGSLNVSPQIIGANQVQDGVFLSGLYMTITYLASAWVYFRAKKVIQKRVPSTD